jgi:hypothetical protein
VSRGTVFIYALVRLIEKRTELINELILQGRGKRNAMLSYKVHL